MFHALFMIYLATCFTQLCLLFFYMATNYERPRWKYLVRPEWLIAVIIGLVFSPVCLPACLYRDAEENAE